jgi:hypothetical protein
VQAVTATPVAPTPVAATPVAAAPVTAVATPTLQDLFAREKALLLELEILKG